MLPGLSALIFASLFTGAALYITVAEQPARLALADSAMLAQWQPSYGRALPMQVALVVLSALAGLAAWWLVGGAGFLAGAALMAANVPVTYAAIMPVNRRLKATAPAEAGPETRALVERWAERHAIRTALGFCAVLAFAWALLALPPQ